MAAHDDFLNDLVHQFSDPFAFYRELIQNSIDAGSSRIEVTVRFNPGQSLGTATACVQDWGEGMNRQVIEQYLLTKFRSSKENDLTKIGKFGIGFLSVFAPAPQAVELRTGKDGESWRLLFKPDLTYELLQSTEAYEGTAVLIHKAMTAAEYGEFAARSKESVVKWCRHSEAAVAFCAGPAGAGALPTPELVREPLAVDAPFQVEYREEGTHIVAGPARSRPPAVGLYNRGLTLIELQEELVEGVTFKILSRYLEHTLTRDNVRRDRHFERAIALVRRLAEKPMLARLQDELKAAAGDEARAADYEVLLSFAHGRLPADELWFRSVRGQLVDGRALRASTKQCGTVLWARSQSPVTDAVEAAGMVVLDGMWGTPTVRIAQAASGGRGLRLSSADAMFCVAQPDTRPAAHVLATSVGVLLGIAGAKTDQVMVGRAWGAGEGSPWLRVLDVGRATPAKDAGVPPFQGGRAPVLCLNTAEPGVAATLTLAERAPDLAALLLVRRLCVAHGTLSEKLDHRLTERSLSRGFTPSVARAESRGPDAG